MLKASAAIVIAIICYCQACAAVARAEIRPELMRGYSTECACTWMLFAIIAAVVATILIMNALWSDEDGNARD